MTDIASIAATAPVFLCSGQGSQKPGMGEELFAIPEVASVFECASDVMGYNMADFICTAEAAKLNDTRYAQPTLCALSIATARALQASGVSPAAVLGFSLGQISALAISGMLSDEDVFQLVKARSQFMAQAAQDNPGAMSALLKADEQSVVELCESCAQGEVLSPANFNCPGQIVISGSEQAIARAEEAWAAAGKRSSRLATSGAFHSPLMQQAAENLDDYFAGCTFNEATIPLICNIDAQPLQAQEASDHLVRQVMSPVRFQQSVETLLAAGAHTFVEVGVGGVLVNLVKRIDKGSERICVQDQASFDACVALCGNTREEKE